MVDSSLFEVELCLEGMNLSDEVVADCCWLSEEEKDPPWLIKELVLLNLCFGDSDGLENEIDDFDLEGGNRGFDNGGFKIGGRDESSVFVNFSEDGGI